MTHFKFQLFLFRPFTNYNFAFLSLIGSLVHSKLLAIKNFINLQSLIEEYIFNSIKNKVKITKNIWEIIKNNKKIAMLNLFLEELAYFLCLGQIKGVLVY